MMKILCTAILVGAAQFASPIRVWAAEAEPFVTVSLAICTSHTREAGDPFLTEEDFENMAVPDDDAGQLRRWVRVPGGSEGGWLELTAAEGSISLPFTYKGPNSLTLYTRVLRDGEPPVFIAREQVLLPDGMKSGVLYAMRAGGTDKNPSFKVAVIDCTSAVSDEMGLLLYNLTNSVKIIQVGRNSEPKKLQPMVPEWMGLSQKRSTVPLKIAAFDEGWKLVYNSVSRLAIKNPTLGLILPNNSPQTTDVNIKLITLPRWPTEEPQP